MQGTILVSTAGQGVLRSNDDGTTWNRIPLDQGLEFDAVVRTLAVHPTRPEVIFAGADVGLGRSDDAGTRWSRVDSPFNNQQVWAIAIDPLDPDSMLVGTGAPVAGRDVPHHRWGCVVGSAVPGTPGALRRREQATHPHPPPMTSSTGSQCGSASKRGGLWRSRNRGDDWERLDGPDLPDGVTNSDIHCILVLEGSAENLGMRGGQRVLCQHPTTEPRGSAPAQSPPGASTTHGSSPGFPAPIRFCWASATRPPGTTTRIFRSDDLAQTWTESTLDVPATSTVWAFATHDADADLIFAGTKYGNLFRSIDGGRTFTKEWRDFPEITDVAWTPAVAAEAPASTSLNASPNRRKTRD
jgi:hypothetical protein